MRIKLTESLLRKLVTQGYTQREIAAQTGHSKSNVGYWIGKYELSYLNNNKPSIRYKDKNYFNKIDTKEKAYIIGFMIADGYINEKVVATTVAKRDKEILKFMISHLGGNLNLSNITNKKQKRYPSASVQYHDKTLIRDIIKQAGGTYKEERRLPRVSPDLERYLLQGFFDGDGCITWGKRKDRNRIWHKISFTSQYKSLVGIQNIIYNQVGAPSTIRPKSDGSDCFVLQIGSRKGVMETLSYMYKDNDMIVLDRKYQNANKLRLELEEFGGS